MQDGRTAGKNKHTKENKKRREIYKAFCKG